MVFSGYMPRSGIARIYDGTAFSFLKSIRTILHVAVSIYVSTNSAKGSLFFSPSPAFIVHRFFNDGHSDQCEVIPH